MKIIWKNLFHNEFILRYSVSIFDLLLCSSCFYVSSKVKLNTYMIKMKEARVPLQFNQRFCCFHTNSMSISMKKCITFASSPKVTSFLCPERHFAAITVIQIMWQENCLTFVYNKMRRENNRKDWGTSYQVRSVFPATLATSVVILVLIEIHCHSCDQMLSYNVTGNNDSLRVRPHSVQGQSSSNTDREVGPVWLSPKAYGERVCSAAFSCSVLPKKQTNTKSKQTNKNRTTTTV